MSSLNCGIVGLPNVGKSTLFNALTDLGIAAENYPFCTIEPNTGIVAIPDPRLDAIAAIVKPQKIIQTYMEFVDIAGIVAGAAKGEGLGNKFLAHIRETDAILHVVRCFENQDIVHVAGRVDPIADIETIHTELALADLESVDQALLRIAKKVKSGDKDAQYEQALLEEVKKVLNDGKSIRSLKLDAKALQSLQPYHFLSIKPILYLANVDEDGINGNELTQRVEALAASEGAMVVPFCAKIEAELLEIKDPGERQEMLSSIGLIEPGLNRIIRASYQLLGLQTYFTAGEKEVRAWTVRKGSTAPQAAGRIHSDFEHGFIRAEVIAYEDFIHYRGEAGAKEAGKWRLEGKEYIVADGDIMHFRFAV